VRGREQSIVGVGVNWYLNTNVKLMVNYVHISVDRLNPASPGNLTPLGVEVGQILDVYALRSQFSFRRVATAASSPTCNFGSESRADA